MKNICILILLMGAGCSNQAAPTGAGAVGMPADQCNSKPQSALFLKTLSVQDRKELQESCRKSVQCFSLMENLSKDYKISLSQSDVLDIYQNLLI